MNLARIPLFSILCILSVSEIFCAQTPRTDSTHLVIRVIDGDTVLLSLDGVETRVRLIGVDTPEIVHPRKPVEFYGREASTFTKNLLRGESVFVEYESGTGTTDKYGRTLAYLYRASDSLFVNSEIIRQGYGHAYTRFPFKYMEQFRVYERTAREAGKGLWAQSVVSGIPASGADLPPTVETEPQDADDVDDAAITVYVTKTGTKYHAEGCRHLSTTKIPKKLGDAKTRYTACKVCSPPR